MQYKPCLPLQATEDGRILPANTSLHIYVMMMNRPNQENGVYGTQTCEGATPVTESRVEQPNPCRNSNTARMKWTKEMNKIVMKCYIKSSPDRRGYRKRMIAIWSEEGICEITEQRLACQARAIKTNGWLSAIEIEEIRRQITVESNTEIWVKPIRQP